MKPSESIFMFYDPEKSFAEDGDGYKSKSFVNLRGEIVYFNVPSYIWNLGLSIYQDLESDSGIKPTLKLLIESAPTVIDTLDQMLTPLTTEKLPILRHPSGERVTTNEIKNASLISKSLTHIGILEQLRRDDYFHGAGLTNAGYFILCLMLLDEAVMILEGLAGQFYQLDELLEIYSCINSIITQVRILQSIETAIKVRASTAAKARNKENNELKTEALSYYDKHLHQFNSRIAAAREISKTVVPVTERTVDSWLKDHIAKKYS